MSRKSERRRQYTLSQKVSEERKREFEKRCVDAGMSQSEMLERCVFGRLPDQTPLPAVLRDHLALVHHLRAALASGALIDSAALDALINATSALISTAPRIAGG